MSVKLVSVWPAGICSWIQPRAFDLSVIFFHGPPGYGPTTSRSGAAASATPPAAAAAIKTAAKVRIISSSRPCASTPSALDGSQAGAAEAPVPRDGGVDERRGGDFRQGGRLHRGHADAPSDAAAGEGLGDAERGRR